MIGRKEMKRFILTSAMIVGLVATSAFAVQNKNSAPKKAKPAPAMKSNTNSGGTMTPMKHKRRHRRHKKTGGASTGASNSNMAKTPKPKTSKTTKSNKNM